MKNYLSAYFSASRNKLTGTIPSEIYLLTNLGALGGCSHCSISLLPACLQLPSFDAENLFLFENTFTGSFTCPEFIGGRCWISCNFETNDECQSLSIPPLTPSPTSSPPAFPSSMAPPTALVDLLASASFDEGSALQTPSTPQNNAWNWLESNINISSYSDKTKIQRYVLATFYYSAGGDDWSNKDGWLSDNDECDWYSSTQWGSLCSSSSGIRVLDMKSNNLKGTIPEELALLSSTLCKKSLCDFS